MKKKAKGLKKWTPAILALALAAAAAAYFILTLNKAPAVNIYFLQDSKILPCSRPLLPGEDILRKAADGLLAGPSESEKGAGIFSELPAGTRIVSLKKLEDEIEVKFNSKLSEYGGGSAKVRGLVAQIVYTFTEAANVTRVRILIGNDKEVVLGGEGYVIDKPLSRDDAGL